MTQTIVITSGKGGVGKTTISVNTAIELSLRNCRTCLFDADLGLANVDILLGIHPENSLDDYLFGDKTLDEIVLQTKFGIDVIPGSSGIEKMANLDRETISDLVTSFSHIKGYDYFLIDTSSGISRGVMAFCLASTATIIVITSESTSLTDAYALLKVMAKNNYTGTVQILVNKSPSIPQAKETYLRLEEVVNRHLPIKIAPVGIILSDPNIEISVTRQEPTLILHPDSIASQCIRSLVSNLLQNDSVKRKEDDFHKFWQRYFDFSHFDYSHLEFTQPYKPADKKTTDKKKSYLKVSPESNSSLSPAAPSAMPPPVPGLDQTLSVETKLSGDLELNPITPFVEKGGSFNVSNLASPTPLLSKALKLQARGELNQETLLAIFSSDPILMVRALQIICGPDTDAAKSKRVTNKQQLVEEMGTEVLTNLLSTTAMQRALCLTSSDTAKLAISFWTHSLNCALISENIAIAAGYPFPEEAFIAGLIHDIGRLVLQTNQPGAYAQFPKTFRHEERLIEMEQRIFGMTHAEIGARALRSWHVDSFLVDAVQYHTESFSKIETAFSLVQIVFLACRLCQSQEDDKEINQLGEALFGLSPTQLQSLTANAGDKTQQLADRFQIPLVEEHVADTTDETQNSFRNQAMEYSILHNVLPSTPCASDLAEIVRTVFQAFNILFSIKPAFCLMPDCQHSFLKAVEYTNCFGWGTLDDVHFSLKWENSLVVKSFISGQLKTAMEDESNGTLALADRQLLRSLGTQGFVCVPMIAHGVNKGIIVFGIAKMQLEKISSLRNRLLQFGVQAGKNIDNREKV